MFNAGPLSSKITSLNVHDLLANSRRTVFISTSTEFSFLTLHLLFYVCSVQFTLYFNHDFLIVFFLSVFFSLYNNNLQYKKIIIFNILLIHIHTFSSLEFLVSWRTFSWSLLYFGFNMDWLFSRPEQELFPWSIFHCSSALDPFFLLENIFK